MKPHDSEPAYQRLLAGIEEELPSQELRDRVLSSSLAALQPADVSNLAAPKGTGTSEDDICDDADTAGLEASPLLRPARARFAFSRARWLRPLVMAAVVALVLFGGAAFWRSGQHGKTAEKWWLQPAAAWAGEIQAALAKIKGLTCREQIAIVEADGTEHISSTSMRFYQSRDSYRRDIYDGDKLREIQWYVPDANHKQVMTSVRFDTLSYFITGPGGNAGNNDPTDWMRALTGMIDRADRLLGTRVIDGRECVGFEVSASKYGTNPAGWQDCIWFDVQTKLPVRIEERGRPVTGDPTRTVIFFKDQFDYSPDLTSDTFVPQIPAGYIQAHPDELKRK